MNCIQKLKELARECEPCMWYGKIVEFEKLPEQEKYKYDYYDRERDFIIYCEKCKVYKLLQSD